MDNTNDTFDFKLNKKLKFNKNKNKDEHIYGIFYGDINLDEEDMDNRNIVDQHYLTLNFVEGKNTPGPKKGPTEIKITERTTDVNEDNIKEELIKDFTDGKKEVGNPKDDKKLEEDLKKRYGKGYHLLKKSGYKIGSGLGAKEQGITDPIEIKKRKKNAGISSKNEVFPDEEEAYDQKKFFLGKKKEASEKIKQTFKEELDEFEKFVQSWDTIRTSAIEGELDPIIGMNLKRSLTKSDDRLNLVIPLGTIKIEDIFKKGKDIDKVKQVFALMIKKTKEKVITYYDYLNSNSNSIIFYENEIEKANEEIDRIRSEVNKREKFVQQLRKLISNIRNQDEAKTIKEFINLNISEYKEDLTYYCLDIIKQHLLYKYTMIDYIKSKEAREVLILIRQLIDKTFSEKFEGTDGYNHIFSQRKENNLDDNSIANKIFAKFLYDVVLKDFANFLIHSWNVKEYDNVIKMFQLYSDILPSNLKQLLITKYILPKLNENLLQFYSPSDDGHSSHNLCHLWIHPWLDVIKYDTLTQTFSIIQNKIEQSILHWDIANLNKTEKLLEMLIPWKRVWDDSFFTGLIDKIVLPKINFMFSKFEINPSNQDMNLIKILFKWNASVLLPTEKCVPTLKKYFFPKFLNTLNKWLSDSISSEKIQEIEKWYTGWKNIFLNNYFTFDEIKAEFKNALIIISKKTTSI